VFNDSSPYDATMPSGATITAHHECPPAPPSRRSTSRSTTRCCTTPRCPPAPPYGEARVVRGLVDRRGRDALGATFTAQHESSLWHHLHGAARVVQRLVAVRRHDARQRNLHGAARVVTGLVDRRDAMPSAPPSRRSTSRSRTRRSTRTRCPPAPPSPRSTSRSMTRRRTTPRCPPAPPSRRSTSRSTTRRRTTPRCPPAPLFVQGLVAVRHCDALGCHLHGAARVVQ